MTTARSIISLGHRNNVYKVMLLHGQQISFGRDAGNDVRLYLWPLEESIFQIATADISRQHFCINCQDFGYTIQDMNSTNGTSLNCVGLTKETPIQNDQIIDVGGVLEFRIVLQHDVLWLQRINNLPQESYIIFKENGFTMGNEPGNVITVASDNPNIYQIKISFDGQSWILSNRKDTPVQVNDKQVFPQKSCQLSNSSDIILGNELILFQIERTPTQIEKSQA